MLKKWLILIAPSASVFLSILWYWVKNKFEDYLMQKEFESFINRAKQTLHNAINDPNSSEKHIKMLRKEVEELELLTIKSYRDRIKILIDRNEL
ncbi:MAG: hypothetical protein GY754_01945 [bacterium]|nr:hypothetical protein [bacterium]